MLFFQEKFQIFEAGTEFACLDAVDDGDGQNQQRKGLHMLYVAVDEVDPASFAGYIGAQNGPQGPCAVNSISLSDSYLSLFQLLLYNPLRFLRRGLYVNNCAIGD